MDRRPVADKASRITIFCGLYYNERLLHIMGKLNGLTSRGPGTRAVLGEPSAAASEFPASSICCSLLLSESAANSELPFPTVKLI